MKDGEAALAWLEATVPTLVLTGVMMPRMDGLELTRRITAEEDHPPVVIFSAKTTGVKMGIDAGAVDYITKPSFSPSDLINRVARAAQWNHPAKRENPHGEILLGYVEDGVTKPGWKGWPDPPEEPARSADQDRTGPLGRPGRDRMETAAASGRPFIKLHIDLTNLKGLNDRHGFVQRDKAIEALGKVVRQVADAVAPGEAQVEHIGGDDFVLFVPDRAGEATEAIRRGFKEEIAPLDEDNLLGITVDEV